MSTAGAMPREAVVLSEATFILVMTSMAKSLENEATKPDTSVNKRRTDDCLPYNQKEHLGEKHHDADGRGFRVNDDYQSYQKHQAQRQDPWCHQRAEHDSQNCEI